MPEPIRFHLDEHIDGAIADGLRRRGIDVTTTADVALRGATDDDYLKLHAQGVPHAGIAFCRPQARSIGEVLRSLILIWAGMSPEEM
jgi:hypothetical protein